MEARLDIGVHVSGLNYSRCVRGLSLSLGLRALGLEFWKCMDVGFLGSGLMGFDGSSTGSV